MNVATRLAGFAAVLALVFGTAAFAGSRIDAHPGKPEAESAMGRPAHGEDTMAAQAVRGLAVSDDGLTLELARTARDPGQALRSGLPRRRPPRRRPCATSTSSTPSACTSSSCGAT